VSFALDFPEPDEASVGKYKLIASLGHGGMADVYLAVVTGLGINKLQVIKRLRRGAATDPEHVALFLDEARLAARVNHPNVVQTFEVGAASGVYFIAMEWLEGAPLNRIMSRARSHAPPAGVLLRVLADALAGLHYAHELTDYDGTPLHVVHRDASPHNVLVTFDGQTKLLDFGIATSDVRSAETRKGAVQGKLTYMAPEQARVKPLDRRADIFVCGITLWEILAGRKMWERASDMEILHKLATGDIPKLEKVRKDVPAPLAKIAARALASEPADRYATAAEMRADLLEWLDKSGVRVSAEEIGKYVTEQFSDKRAEIQKVIERQLRKLPDSSEELPDANMPESMDPASIGRLSAMPIDLTASGLLPSIPGFRSVAPPGEEQRSEPIEVPAAPPPPPPLPAVERVSFEPPQSRARILIVLAAVIIATALGVFIALRARQAAHPNAAPGASNSGAAPSAKLSAPKTTIELKVRAMPAHATIFLDGVALPSNPHKAEVAVDGLGHRLRAEAPDHHPAAQIVMFDDDVDVELVLQPKAKTEPATGSTEKSPTNP